MMNPKAFWLVFIICLCCAAVLNVANLFLVQHYPTDTYHLADNGVTLWSPDNEYYLDPVDNYLKGREWRRNPPLGDGSYYRRTPGYSILYFLSTKIANNDPILRFYIVVLFQSLLFAISLYVIWMTVGLLTQSVIVSGLITLLFGSSPLLSNSIFLTITESLFPYFIIYYLYWLLKASLCKNCGFKERIAAYTLACLFITLSILTRPVTGILSLALLFSYFQFLLSNELNFKKLITNLVLVMLPPVALIGLWTARNYYKTGDLVLLEVSIHPESHDRMKPEFRAVFGFTKSWGEDGAVMNQWQLPLYHHAIWKNDTSVIYVKNALDTFPLYVVEHFGRARLQDALVQYQKTVYSQKVYYDQNIPMPSTYSSLQLDTEVLFDELTAEFAKTFSFNYYIHSPLIYLKRSILNSNTSTIYLFQEPFRKYKILVLIRYSLLGLTVLSYATILFNIWSFRCYANKLVLFCVVPILYLCFFAFYFKEIEQRYLLPALLIAVLGLHKPLELLIRSCESKLLKKYIS